MPNPITHSKSANKGKFIIILGLYQCVFVYIIFFVTDRLPLPLPGNTGVGKQTRQSAESYHKRQSLFVSHRRRFNMQCRSRQHDIGPKQCNQEYFSHRPPAAHH